MLDRPHGEPFTRAIALQRGVTPRQLAGPRFQRVFRGVYIPAGAPVSDLVLAKAALLLHPPGARISHHTAAQLYGLPVPQTADVHVSVPVAGNRRATAGVRSRLCPGSTIIHRGMPVSSPVQLFTELAGLLSLVDLVVLGDALLTRQHMADDRFRDLVASSNGRSRAAAARAATLVRGGVDSPMESRLRLLLVLAGLPGPVVNHTLRTEDGHPFMRFDVAYPAQRVIVEYDGRQHAHDATQWLHDITRREWLDEQDWRLVIVTAEGIYREPEATLRRVTETLRRRGLVVELRSEQWRRHFPPRRRGG